MDQLKNAIILFEIRDFGHKINMWFYKFNTVFWKHISANSIPNSSIFNSLSS